MKFLVITKSKHLAPPEVAVGLIDAMGPWQSKYAGKFEQIWGFAGIQGGGGIVNVGSLEELDAIMTEFPFLVFSKIEIIPLVDLDGYLQRTKQVAQAMAAGGRG
jgi:muconolactone delta-isomerase